MPSIRTKGRQLGHRKHYIYALDSPYSYLHHPNNHSIFSYFHIHFFPPVGHLLVYSLISLHSTISTTLIANMQFSIVAVFLGLSAFAMANPMPQNQGRPVAQGSCCVPNTSLKQDACNSPQGAGRCVPGGSGTNCESTRHSGLYTSQLILHHRQRSA